MRIKHFFYLFFLILFSACEKTENPFVSKAVIDSLIARQNPVMKNVAFIYNNDVYFLPAFDKDPVRITNSPNVPKKWIRMSHDFQKFAYLNSSNNIEIVDTKGLQLARLTQYSNVKAFDWSSNDATLYILNNNSMAYYGPSMNLPAITYPGINFATTTEVLSASVSSKGDFAYVFYAFNPWGLDYYKLVVKKAGGGTDLVYQDEHQDEMGYVAFSTNEQDLVVGFKQRTSTNQRLQKLSFFTDLKSYPDFSLENSTQEYSTPKYNSKIGYMVGGYLKDRSNIFNLTAMGLVPGKDLKVVERQDFSSNGNVIYTDWK